MNWNNIKEYRFAAKTPGSLAGGSAFTVGSSYVLNGQIISVGWKTNITPGSLFLLASGTEGQELIWSAQTGSVSAYTVQYPVVYPVNNSGAAISGAGGTVVNRVINSCLVLGGSGPDGGSIVSYVVRYR